MRSIFSTSFALAAFLLVSPALAQNPRGAASARDGDTLQIGTTTVRLHGIDAPEADQACRRDGQAWACGTAATRQLAALVANAEVSCVSQGVDVYGRTLAVCRAKGLEINRTMVAQGWATAFREYSGDYVSDELRAKASRLGLWTSAFELPGDFRAAKAGRAEALRAIRAQSTASNRAVPLAEPFGNGRCAIKGNRNRRGQWIYHVPGMPYYEATRAEEIFCSEAQAQAAGYRRAIVK